MEASLKERIGIGQRLVVGLPGYELNAQFIQLVKDYKIGNVILFRHNICNATQASKLCKELQTLIQHETGFPAFITIDQEGGVVTRLAQDATNIPGAMALAATGDSNNAYTAGYITGCELNAIGVNFNLAPDVDINSNLNNPVIGVRSYGSSVGVVNEYSKKMMHGLRDGGVLTCAKHFPGHGDTEVDSHLSLPSVQKTLWELEQNELLPFAHAITHGVDAIMTAHILFPKIEFNHLPATMSRTLVTDILRKKMGYTGLILSDCMEMNAIAKFYGTAQGVKAAFCAGVDMAFISHYADVAEAAAILTQESLESGELNRDEHEESVQRIVSCKKEKLPPTRYGVEVVGCDAHLKKVKEMFRQSITVKNELCALGKMPLFIGCNPFRTTEASNKEDDGFCFPQFLQQKHGGYCEIMSSNPDQDEIRRITTKALAATAVVVGTYQAHLNHGQLDLVRSIVAEGYNTICVALRNPYDLEALPDSMGKICAYEYSKASVQAVAELLKK